MATFNELAKRYAQRIREAMSQDGFAYKHKIYSHNIVNSKTLREAKAIKQEIDNLVYTNTNQPLTEIDKKKIIDQIDSELGISRRTIDKGFVTNASNDDFSDMADEIENILKGK